MGWHAISFIGSSQQLEIHPGFIAVVCVNEIAFGLARLSCGVITPAMILFRNAGKPATKWHTQ